MKNCPKCKAAYPTHFSNCPQDGTPLVEGSAWAEGILIRGKYQILGKLGEGGMGSVFKALHVAFNELRALKVISPTLMADELFVRRFKQEAVITRSLVHQNAVRVDDIDEAEDGRPFIVMEYIEGKSLKELIQENGPLPVPRVCSIIKQVAAALGAAHQLHMVHRDIKPGNIVLVNTPQGELAKVLDFGIAKIKEAHARESAVMRLSSGNIIMGTPEYMSPEQASGKGGNELDGRSDLYSLGVVMYEMLSGDLPFKAETTMSMMLARLQTPPRPLRTLHPELQIPASVANLVMKTLEKDPTDRPPTAEALIAEIENVEGAFSPCKETLRGVPQGMGLGSGEEAGGPAMRPQVAPPPSAFAEVRAAGPPAIATSAVPAGTITQQPAPPAGTRYPPTFAPTQPAPARKSSKTVAAVGILSVLLVGAIVGLWYVRGRPGLKPPGATPPSASQQDVADRINEGDMYFSHGDFKGAILEYKRAAELDPSNVDVRHKLAHAEESESREHARNASATQARSSPVSQRSAQAGLQTQPGVTENLSSLPEAVPLPTQAQAIAPSNPSPAGPTTASAPITKVTKNGFTFELKWCRKPSDSDIRRLGVGVFNQGNIGLICDLTITNNEAEDRDLTIGMNAVVFDELGNSYWAGAGGLGNAYNTFASQVGNTLLTGAPTNARLVIGRLSPGVNLLTSLDMDCFSQNRQFKLQFRNIPIRN